jgi:hypothetical protein
VDKVKLGVGNAAPTVVGEPVSLGAGTQLPLAAAIDTLHGYAYFTSGGKVVKLALGADDAGPKVVGSCTALTGDKAVIRRAVIDPDKGYAYFCSIFGAKEGHIAKVKLGTGDAAPTTVGSLTLPAGLGHLNAAAIDTVHGYAYFAGAYAVEGGNLNTTPHGCIVKVRLGAEDALPVFVSSIETTERYFTTILIDPAQGNLYLGNDLTYPSSDVVCVAFGAGDAPMKKVGSLKLRVGPKPWNDPSRLAPTSTPDLGEVHIQSGVIDLSHGYAYFGTDTWPGQVVKLRLLGH